MKKCITKFLSIVLSIVTIISINSFGFSASAANYTTSVKTGSYATIKNVGAGKMLNVYGSKAANNTNITVYANDNTTGQQVKATSYNGGYYFTFKCSTSRALNIYGTSCKESANVCIWNLTKNSTQLWTIEYVSSKSAYIIRSKSNKDYCLTANGSSNGSNVCIKKYTGSNYQLWTSSLFSTKTTNSTTSSGTTGSTSSTSSSEKITTAQIQAVLDKYNYVSDSYWTTYEDTGTKTAHDGSQVKWDNKDCPSSTSPKKNSTGKHYVSYNYNNTWECCGFASYVMYKVTGKAISAGSTSAKAQNGWKVYTSTKSAGSFKVGDIIRYNGHSAIVYSVDKNGNATFAECWGSKGCVIKVNSGFNTTKGTRNIDYFNNSNFKYIYRYEG